MSWIQAHLTTEKSNTPLIELLFESLGALSITLGDAEDDPQLEPKPGELPLWQQTRITGLFAGDTNADDLRSQIDQALKREASSGLQLEVLEDQVWERAWMDNFHPMKFGEHLWVCPNGELPDEADAVIIELDPGLAFGTGTHPTTSLCLQWLDQQALNGKTVIDFGCGSGILAIAALKLGADRVIALDHDPQALEATEDNARKNGVFERLTVARSIDPAQTSTDILLANILAGTLIELEPLLASLTRTGGKAALSGILAEQTESVSQAFNSDFNMLKPVQQQEWILLEGVRKT